MSLFKKPKRNFRQRVKRNDSEEEDDQRENSSTNDIVETNKNVNDNLIGGIIAASQGVGVAAENKTKAKIPRETPVRQNVLSFEEEEDEGKYFQLIFSCEILYLQ